jgi:copper chaperone CopZ
MCSEEDKVNVMNALHKYSGVLDIAVDTSTQTVRVEYDPRNVIREDLKDEIVDNNYQVTVINP